MSSRVVAQVQYLPPGQKAYVIQNRTGSGRGEQVVKRMLEHESEMSRRNSQASPAALNEENYTSPTTEQVASMETSSMSSAFSRSSAKPN